MNAQNVEYIYDSLSPGDICNNQKDRYRDNEWQFTF